MMETNAKKLEMSGAGGYLLVFWVCLIVLAIVYGAAYRWQVKSQVDTDYTALIGRIWQQSPEDAEKFMKYLLADSSAQDVPAGETALVKMGYTADGMRVAKDRLYQGEKQLAAVGGALIVGSICFGMFLLRALHLVAQKEGVRVQSRMQDMYESRLLYMQASIGQMRHFLENVAHQVKVPFAGMLLALDLAEEGQDTETAELLEESKRQIHRIDQLMNRLLKIGRMEAGQIIFEKALEDLSSILEHLPLPAQQKKRLNLTLESAEMAVDYDWMTEAVLCVIEDCLEVSGETEPVQIHLEADEQQIRMRIEGNAVAFTEDEVESLFNRYYIPRQIHGMGHYGIGLHLAKLVIEGHNGVIRVFKEGERGGFFICFPRFALKSGKMSQ